MIHTTQCVFGLNDNELDGLVRHAIICGYARKEPKSGWTAAEKKDAVRFAIHEIIANNLIRLGTKEWKPLERIKQVGK